MNTFKQHQRYLQLVLNEVDSHASEKDRAILRSFAETALANVDVEDLDERKPENIYGALNYAWRFLQQHNIEHPKISLINPNYEEHGWQSPHSVALVLARNMAFLEESIRLTFNQRNITIHFQISTDLLVKRDANYRLKQILPGSKENGATRLKEEAIIMIEFSRHSNPKDLDELQTALVEIVDMVELVVDDFLPMCDQVKRIASDLETLQPQVSAEVRSEWAALLDWLMNKNFTFLGYEEIVVDWSGGQPNVADNSAQRLGLLKRRQTVGVEELSEELRQYGPAGDPYFLGLAFFKSTKRASVHRISHPDYVAVRRYDERGRVCGEFRFLGLFTAIVYSMQPTKIPVLRRKVEQVLDRSGIHAERYRARGLLRVLEVLPRDELFQCDIDTLYHTAMRIYHIQERRKIRLFVRPDRRRKFVFCLVYMPRDIYHTELRQRIQQLLVDAFGVVESEFNTSFSESVLVTTYFVMRLGDDSDLDYDERDLERLVERITQQWEDMFHTALYDEFGEEQGAKAKQLYRNAFPPGYRDDYDPQAAVSDVRRFSALEDDGDLGVNLYRSPYEADDELHLRLYSVTISLDLSDVIPILENLGMRVLGEHPYEIERSDGKTYWIHDFALSYTLSDEVDVFKVREVFEQAFLAVWDRRAESDSFNRLVIGTRLGWREIAMLRALAQYMKQVRFPFSTSYIAETLGKHLKIALDLVELFRARFDPDLDLDVEARETREQEIGQRIVTALDQVDQLNEDRIVRHYLALIRAAVRTNYFQLDATGMAKDYFAFKLSPTQIPDLPKPVPAHEIFVYSPRVEGVHLRGGKVARGGIRWSDRLEDFRTEVLGLVKAQQVKNAVIVPVGAKGGFVVKRLSLTASREEVQTEGVACYKTFISALLDVTDNLVGDSVIPPKRVLRKDDDDTYLVVAADKGTATFSDIANGIAKEYGFWLGDAFASGGSNGYDHKKMGITARGAWVSVERHFREMGVNVQTDEFSVIGIGDMAGDVFGNGMLLSEKIRLVGAFNHMHVFVDPDPDTAASFKERRRLFDLLRSSWADYDATLISAGGGVFSRAAKSIPISAEMKRVFDVAADHLTPNELISAMLKANVDLIWNGGIGTYVKSRHESHADVGDKSNDGLRVNGVDLRCKVIGEGGNLGLTQLGRVEFALNGGRCLTDFIDNSAGVDCSDHEVNVKILLNQLVESGDLTDKQRSRLLEQMTEDVAVLVLHDNYRQTQAISVAVSEAPTRMNEYRRLISSLESQGRLDRSLEFLPDDEMLQDRRKEDKGLTAPELSILTSYMKNMLKETIAASDIPEDDFTAGSVRHAFPALMYERFAQPMRRHKLRREIIATQIANDIVDLMGLNFVPRMLETSSGTLPEIVRAYVIARDVYVLDELWSEIEALDYRVAATTQMNLMTLVQRQMRLATRWLLRNSKLLENPGQTVEMFGVPMRELNAQIGELLTGLQKENYLERLGELREARVPESLAVRTAGTRAMAGLLGIIDEARDSRLSVIDVARIDFTLRDRLNLYWFAKEIAALKVDNYWQSMARETFLDELEWQSRSICARVLDAADFDPTCDDCVDTWIEQHKAQLARWNKLVDEIKLTTRREYALFAVAVRGLLEVARVIGN